MADATTKKSNYFNNANFPVDAEGRTYHVNTKRGQVANRIITVGDPYRAWLVAKTLDGASSADLNKLAHLPAEELNKLGASNQLPFFVFLSHRGFLTITGTYKNVPISIIAIGMGLAMVDFMVRECRAVIDGPMAIIRFGSCGGIRSTCKAGQVSVAESSMLIQRNYSYFHQDEVSTKPNVPYDIYPPLPSSPELTSSLKKELCKTLGEDRVISGLNCTADSFYSSQGRVDSTFYDANADLISQIKQSYPNATTLEMETYLLVHLARCITSPENAIYATAATMIFFNRETNQGITKEQIRELEESTGKALMESLAHFDLGVRN